MRINYNKKAIATSIIVLSLISIITISILATTFVILNNQSEKEAPLEKDVEDEKIEPIPEPEETIPEPEETIPEPEETIPEPACVDSDGGKDYYTKGTISPVNETYDEIYGVNYDSCVHLLTGPIETCGEKILCFLVELYCSDTLDSLVEPHLCPYGCNDGACLHSGSGVSETVILNVFGIEAEYEVGVPVFSTEKEYTLPFPCPTDACDVNTPNFCDNICSNSGGFSDVVNNPFIHSADKAYECHCEKLPSEQWNFEIPGFPHNKDDCYFNNRIKVKIKNTGLNDINKEDWIIHEIDGVEVPITQIFSINLGEINTVILTEESYSSGDHNVTLGLKEGPKKSITFTCE